MIKIGIIKPFLGIFIIIAISGCVTSSGYLLRNSSEDYQWLSKVKKIVIFPFRSLDRVYALEAKALNKELNNLILKEGVFEIIPYENAANYSTDIDTGLLYPTQKALKNLKEVFEIEAVIAGEFIDIKVDNYNSGYSDRRDIFQEYSFDKTREYNTVYVTKINITFISTDGTNRYSYTLDAPKGSINEDQVKNIARNIIFDLEEKIGKYPWKKSGEKKH